MLELIFFIFLVFVLRIISRISDFSLWLIWSPNGRLMRDNLWFLTQASRTSGSVFSFNRLIKLVLCNPGVLLVTTRELNSCMFSLGIRFSIIADSCLKRAPLSAVISSCPTTKTNRTVFAFSIIFFIIQAFIRLIACLLFLQYLASHKIINYVN